MRNDEHRSSHQIRPFPHHQVHEWEICVYRNMEDFSKDSRPALMKYEWMAIQDQASLGGYKKATKLKAWNFRWGPIY